MNNKGDKKGGSCFMAQLLTQSPTANNIITVHSQFMCVTRRALMTYKMKNTDIKVEVIPCVL